MFRRACSPRLGFVVLSLILGVTLCGACARRRVATRKPSPACRESEALLDRAITLADFAKAREERPQAYSACGDRPELRVRDQRIVDGEAKLASERLATERRNQELAAVVRAFLDFVARNREHPERASLTPRCTPRAEPAGTKGGGEGASVTSFCVASRRLGARHMFEVHYALTDPQAFRFTTTLDGPLACRDVEGKETRSWRVPTPTGGSFTRSRCELAQTLDGLTAIVSSALPSTLHVVSASYVKLEPAARASFEP